VKQLDWDMQGEYICGNEDLYIVFEKDEYIKVT
jgi:hypothetical protein